MKKLLLSSMIIVVATTSFADALSGLLGAASNPNTTKCMNHCDAGILLTAMGKSNSSSGKMSKHACSIACTDSCFSGKIASGSKTEPATIACKDSLTKTFSNQ